MCVCVCVCVRRTPRGYVCVRVCTCVYVCVCGSALIVYAWHTVSMHGMLPRLSLLFVLPPPPLRMLPQIYGVLAWSGLMVFAVTTNARSDTNAQTKHMNEYIHKWSVCSKWTNSQVPYILARASSSTRSSSPHVPVPSHFCHFTSQASCCYCPSCRCCSTVLEGLRGQRADLRDDSGNIPTQQGVGLRKRDARCNPSPAWPCATPVTLPKPVLP